MFIKEKYEKVGENTVTVHRRIITRLFYINLKSKTYLCSEIKSRFLFIPLVISYTSILLPKGRFITYKTWKHKGKITSRSNLIECLNKANK